MFTSKKKINLLELEKYRLPIYARKSKEKVVYFYVLDPQSVIDGEPRMVRIRKKFAHIHGARQRDEAAMRFRDEVSRKLREGWNPLVEDCTPKGFTTFDDAIRVYERYLKKMKKDEVFTAKTCTDYNSRLDMLKRFNREGTHILYMYQFNTAYVSAFLEWIYIDRDTSPRTRNNYLAWISSLGAFFRQNGYVEKNPAEGFRSLREKDKFRKPLDVEDMRRLREHLEQTDRYFLLACMFQYYTFIRPKEMMCLHVGDISLKRQTVFVSHNISKNRKDGMATLPARVIRLMIELGVCSYPSDYYLFGKDFMPGAQKCSERSITYRWKVLRKELGFPACYQFYSLKDTGITDVIEKIGLATAKDQARHHSVDVTNRYVRNAQMSVHPELLNYEGSL